MHRLPPLFTNLPLALLISVAWATIWPVIATIVLLFSSGNFSSSSLTPFFITALVIGTFLTFIRPQANFFLHHSLGCVVAVAILFITSGFSPFGVALGSGHYLYDLTVIAVVVIIWMSTNISLGRYAVPFFQLRLTRFHIEVILLRGLKGVGLIFFTLLVAIPFLAMVITSFKTQQELLSSPLNFSLSFDTSPKDFFRAYIELFTTYRFGTFLLNSSLVSLLTVATTLLLSIPGAYVVVRLRFPGRDFLTQSILLIYMIPAIVLVIPLYTIFSQLGLRNSLGGLLIVYPATTIPVALYMFQGYFRSLPVELEEAGLMDGLTRFGVILKITLPLALPAIVSVGLYVFMIAWNEFLFAFMFLDNIDIFTLSRGVVSMNSSEVPRQYLMAGAVVSTLPIVVAFLCFERFLVSGLTASAVKG